jgi:hypothetical protein
MPKWEDNMPKRLVAFFTYLETNLQDAYLMIAIGAVLCTLDIIAFIWFPPWNSKTFLFK